MTTNKDITSFIKKDSLLIFSLSESPFTERGNVSFNLHGCYFSQELYSDHCYSLLGIKRPVNFSKMLHKRRAEYLAGRYCAKQALASLNITSSDIDKDAMRCPIWPESICGSISHTPTLALAVVSDRQDLSGIGIDIEPIVDQGKASDLTKQILFKPTETKLYQQALYPNYIFTLIFSLKESFYKAAYPQVKKIFDFDAIEVIEIDEQQMSYRLRINQTLSNDLIEGKVLQGYYQELDNNLVTLCVI